MHYIKLPWKLRRTANETMGVTRISDARLKKRELSANNDFGKQKNDFFSPIRNKNQRFVFQRTKKKTVQLK